MQTYTMPLSDSATATAHEWAILQPLYERYEASALGIKLLTVALFSAGLVVDVLAPWLMLLCLLLWMQEAIFKTYQGRLGSRLLQLEAVLGGEAGAVSTQAFQLHRDWLAQRTGPIALLLEYLRSALRPTVLFPYAPLLLVALALWVA